MLEILILGLSGVIGGASPSSPPRTTPERPDEARPAFHQADVRTSSMVDASAKEAPSRSRTVCTIRVMRADPRIDREMVKAVEWPVDQGMVVPSVCAR